MLLSIDPLNFCPPPSHLVLGPIRLGGLGKDFFHEGHCTLLHTWA